METSPTTRPDTAPTGSGTEIKLSRTPRRNPAVAAMAAQAAARIAGDPDPVLTVAAFQSSI